MRKLERQDILSICDQLDALGWLNKTPGLRPTDPPRWDVHHERDSNAPPWSFIKEPVHRANTGEDGPVGTDLSGGDASEFAAVVAGGRPGSTTTRVPILIRL
jgi:hypothetical protein